MCAYELIHKSTLKLSFRMLMSKKHFIYYYSTVSHELKWTIQHTNQIPRPLISVTGAFHNVGHRSKDSWLTGPYTNREWCHIERAGRGGNCMVAKQSLLLCLLSGYTVKCLPRDQEVGGSSLARRSEILRPYLTFREVYGMCAYELIHKSTSKLSFRMLMSKKHFIYS